MLQKLVAAAAQSRAHRVLRRRLLLIAATAAVCTGAVAGALLGSPLGPELAIPGPISDSHATLASDCGNCHTASMTSLKGPLHGIVASHTSFEESTNCTGCHALGAHALAPHSPTPAQTIVPASLGAHAPQASADEIACTTCHHEHRGRDASLTALSATRCQSCHAENFPSIAQGHPSFGDYPYVKRLSIAFDHATHIGRHFQGEEAAPETCMDCHRSDSEGGMRVAGFDDSCASCHAAEIEGHGRADATGLAFLGLPAVDVSSLEEAGVDIGMWPADANFADAPITPITALLLAGDPRAAADLELVEELAWVDLYDASEEERAAVGRIIWDVKTLLAELAAGGQDVLRQRLESTLDRKISNAALAELSGGLSPAALRSALRNWLPHLEDELRTRGAAAYVFEAPIADALEPDEEWVLAGGWYSDDYTFTLRRRPCGHADPFLKSWLDLSVAAGGATGSGPMGSLFSELSDADGPGQCAKCHSIDALPETESAQVNWREPSHDFSRGALVQFSHEPHVTLLDDQGCSMCHQLAESTEGFKQTYSQFDPRELVSAFTPLGPDDCAQCHTPKVSGGDCLTCHQYHGERPQPARLQALPSLRPEKQSAALEAEASTP